MKTNINSLSMEEKIALAEQLWQSIETERTAYLTDEQKELLDKRIEIHDKNPNAGRPWSEIKKKFFN